MKESDKERLAKIDLFLSTIKSLGGNKKRPIDEKILVKEVLPGKWKSKVNIRANKMSRHNVSC